jgi:hypothetical protein
MSEGRGVEQILGKVAEREREYDWLGAAEFYKKAIGLVAEQDFLKIGDIYERLGYAFFRAAMQAESQEEFRNRMRQGVADSEKAKESYSRLGEPGKAAWMLRCDAVIVFMGYWLASNVPEKKRLLDECWRRTKEALDAFKETGNQCLHLL